MPWRLRLHWILFIPVRVALWPLLWYDIRQRRLGRKPDEWHKLDLFLCNNNHVVRTYGYFFWEKRAKLCVWCLSLWLQFFCILYGVYYYYVQM